MPDPSRYDTILAALYGPDHGIEPSAFVHADRAESRLPEILEPCAGGRRVAVLYDTRTRDAAGEDAANVLRDAGWRVHDILVPDPAPSRDPVCDDRTKEYLEDKIPPVDTIIPVGGGVLSDLGKWIAFDRDLPYAAVATAASMNGYTSANVAPAIEGVKTLVRARPPRAVLADPAVLRAAPYPLTAAGLGDVLAKSVSSVDWWMNHTLFGDAYDRRTADLVADLEPLYRTRPEAIREGDPGARAALFDALCLTGVAMTLAGTSAPASGGEHLVSHALDMMSALDGHPHDLHGRQVGVGTVLAAETYRRVLALDAPAFRLPPPETDRAFWGRLAPVVQKQYAQKRDRLARAAAAFSDRRRWDTFRENASAMAPAPESIRDCLRRAGAAYRAEDLGISPERLLDAFLHGSEMRSRFTLLDVARMTGVLPGAGPEIVDAFAT